LDAAAIDGCSLRGAFANVTLPLVLPGIAVATILSFTASWNNFLLSLVVAGPRTTTLPVLAYSQMAFDRIEFGAMAASGIVVTAPILLLTLFVQRYLVTGLSMGGTVG
jgi:multiple sugar transport system permease protein